jgi:NAD(P)H-dependent FMN reductase
LLDPKVTAGKIELGPYIAVFKTHIDLISDFPFKEERAMLILAEMTTAGSLATGDYTRSCIDIARMHKQAVIGFVAT